LQLNHCASRLCRSPRRATWRCTPVKHVNRSVLLFYGLCSQRPPHGAGRAMLIHTRPVNKTHKIDASSKNNRHVHFSVRRLTRSRQIISHPTTTACSTAPAPAVRTAGPHFLVALVAHPTRNDQGGGRRTPTQAGLFRRRNGFCARQSQPNQHRPDKHPGGRSFSGGLDGWPSPMARVSEGE
jgi:hypothetical protein